MDPFLVRNKVLRSCCSFRVLGRLDDVIVDGKRLVLIGAVIFEPVSPIADVKIFASVMFYEELSQELAILQETRMLLQ